MGPDDDEDSTEPQPEGNPADATDEPPPSQPGLPRGLGNRDQRTPRDEVARKRRAERVERVGELLLANKTKRAIARELGVDESTVRADVERWVEINPSPSASVVRVREDARLEKVVAQVDRAMVQLGVAVEVAAGAMKRGIDTMTGLPTASLADQLKALKGAADSLASLSGRAIQVSESIRRLHGVDAPRQVHVTSETTSEVVHHVVSVSFEETLRVIEQNVSPPALPAAEDTIQ